MLVSQTWVYSASGVTVTNSYTPYFKSAIPLSSYSVFHYVGHMQSASVVYSV